MKRAAVLTTALLALGGTSASAQTQACPDPGALTRGVAAPLDAVRYLADDALEGRLAGTAAERCAGDYIAARFRRIGLAPAGEGGTYFQDVPLASAVNPHAPGGTGRNVIGILRGRSKPDEVVVVGAHYDHLGHGGALSLTPGEDAIHNGADDNASGVAALLAVAERMARGPRPARSVVFVAFTGEESGLLGSAHFAGSPLLALPKTRAMLNMDMVGRLGAGPLIVYGVETAGEWPGLVERAAAAEGVAVRASGDGYGASDHTAFYVKDLPVLHFFTNVHGDYHKPSDDWEKVDAAGISKVAAIVARVAGEVAGRPEALTFRRAPAPPRAQTAAATPGYGAYLGSVPDFSPVEGGVRLSGVRAGSPAEKAGIRAGDVLVRVGAHDTPDLQGLTDALRAHRAGDTVPVVLRRGAETVTVTVTFGTRGGG
ncbi:MAG TPA: M20/M25/M40 family metallo-hydrolase [Longimicrobium sp.]|nr:M20/M25/M40 family metallo-hydrolase [Longimicrobium sp.]